MSHLNQWQDTWAAAVLQVLVPSQHCISDVISATKQLMSTNTALGNWTLMQMTDSQVTMEKMLLLREHLKIFVSVLIVKAFQSNELFCLEAGIPRKAEGEEVQIHYLHLWEGLYLLDRIPSLLQQWLVRNVFWAVVKVKASFPLCKFI